MQSIAAHKSVSKAATYAPDRLQGYPNSYIYSLRMHVNGSGTIHSAIKCAAPHTSLDLMSKFDEIQNLFPPTFEGHAEKEVILICLGQFAMQRRIEDLITNSKKNPILQDTDLRTLLAIGRQYPSLCRTLGVKSMRLVCLTAKLKHTDHLDHVCTLRQVDDVDAPRNALTLEPYRYGWSAEHVFALTRAVR